MSDAPHHGWEAPRNMIWLGLFTCVCVCESTGKRCLRRLKKREEGARRELVKRGSPFCTGGNRVAQPLFGTRRPTVLRVLEKLQLLSTLRIEVRTGRQPPKPPPIILRLVDNILFVHALVAWMDTRAILRNGLNKHVTVLTRVIYDVGSPNDTV
jgi:hypothetical protein